MQRCEVVVDQDGKEAAAHGGGAPGSLVPTLVRAPRRNVAPFAAPLCLHAVLCGAGKAVPQEATDDLVDGSEQNQELLLRSQLISMYTQPVPERKRLGSDSSGRMSPLLTLSNTSKRWQRSLSKLVSLNRLSRRCARWSPR